MHTMQILRNFKSSYTPCESFRTFARCWGIMIHLTGIITVIPSKKQELLQTLHELQPLFLQNEGCQQFLILPQKNALPTIKVREQWTTCKDLVNHVHSEYFRVLFGALKILTQSTKMTMRTNSHTVSMDWTRSTPLQQVHNTWFEDVLAGWSAGENRMKVLLVEDEVLVRIC